jgi:hypothetical protein
VNEDGGDQMCVICSGILMNLEGGALLLCMVFVFRGCGAFLITSFETNDRVNICVIAIDAKCQEARRPIGRIILHPTIHRKSPLRRSPN